MNKNWNISKIWLLVILLTFSILSKAQNPTNQISVTYKKQTPPSGDKHDYMSLAPYWWPDTTNADGLPYIRRDGQRNPEEKEYTDKAMLNKMSKELINLTNLYSTSKELHYIEKANQLLRAWFLDSATRMNPNLNYAQAIKGRNEGRGAGLIETRIFIPLLDAVEILREDSAFEKETYPELKQWFIYYLDWMQSSENGKKEKAAKNNHGTWYTAQYARIAIFIGHNDLALKELETLKKRIAWQIESDGKQPLELERTKSLSYSIFNLEAYYTCFSMSEKLGLYLWDYETSDGCSVNEAIDYIHPFIDDQINWPHKQITVLSKNELLKAEKMYMDFMEKRMNTHKLK